MLLAIDVGNTRIKSAVFHDSTLLELFTFSHDELERTMVQILSKYPQCKEGIVANVGKFSVSDFQQLSNKVRWRFLTHQSNFPFVNKYATPETLGIDRMVLAAGAVLLYPKHSRLVIDAGTCITYDFVNSSNEYLGGAISPGIRLRYEALHHYTAKLPLLQTEVPKGLTGDSTHESIHTGVVQGVLNEMDGFIEQYAQQYNNIITILTGGDAEFLAKRLKNTIFAHSNFLLESLNQTFQYQITHD